jgi:hypothetical protein
MNTIISGHANTSSTGNRRPTGTPASTTAAAARATPIIVPLLTAITSTT